jgi:CRP/FNR family transcriptional regulator, cyclic AMP receptor protein
MQATYEAGMKSDPHPMRGLPQEIYNLLEGKAKAINLKKHQFLYQERDVLTKVYIIASGRMKLGYPSEDGRELIKAILYPGYILGALSMEPERSTNFAQVMSPEAVVYEIELADYIKLLKISPDFTMRIVKAMYSKIDYFENRLEAMAFRSARQRIIDIIKEMVFAEGLRIGKEWLIKDFPTHQDIANVTGISRQTVTILLNTMRQENIIYFNRKNLLIRDIKDLQ